MIGHGLWILIPILSFTLLSWLPATQAWWRSRSALWAAVALLLLLGTVTFVASTVSAEPGDAIGALIIALGIGGVVAAAFARPVVFGHRADVQHRPVVTRQQPVPPDRITADPAVQDVLRRRERRNRAREIATQDLAMAYELAIGRPDLPRSFDDGGLVDLNNVTADGLVSVLRWDRAVAETYATARDIRGGYVTWDEVNALSGLEPSMVERDAERLILLPWRAR
ncbi:hypothetical protein [Jiangella sp. DSM 45060]|uniref:hypothetical protein n=1 Tax=Jiangella sp. DSM 45060 TaxID=1798224 RepID=UPI00087A2D7A|nr:hypothetical protein [Jiangella sp. DSM 45060]SDS82758.1 hypothetical protein SAMN04515669_2028 [Jiangella sp. DSM 45060]